MSKLPADFGPFSPDPAEFRRQTFQDGESPRRPLPQFKVILLNNADLDMMFVVRTVMELTRFCRTEATLKMWQAHYNGRAVILITHRERAELFAEQFEHRGLKVALEPS
jgi:ATP-dependent Clp protease adapter protein ClpS